MICQNAVDGSRTYSWKPNESSDKHIPFYQYKGNSLPVSSKKSVSQWGIFVDFPFQFDFSQSYKKYSSHHSLFYKKKYQRSSQTVDIIEITSDLHRHEGVDQEYTAVYFLTTKCRVLHVCSIKLGTYIFHLTFV